MRRREIPASTRMWVSFQDTSAQLPVDPLAKTATVIRAAAPRASGLSGSETRTTSPPKARSLPGKFWYPRSIYWISST